MRWPVIQLLYKDLTNNSFEFPVGTLWQHILRFYFRIEDNYVVGLASYGDVGEGASLVIRHVNTPRRLTLVENAQISEEDSNTAWDLATQQLAGCMKNTRNEQLSSATVEDIHGIITIGHYSRYYTLRAGEMTLCHFRSVDVDYDGQALHFKNDEYTIHMLLMEIAGRSRA